MALIQNEPDKFDSSTTSATQSIRCPDGADLVWGGGRVTTTADPMTVQLTGSYPLDTTAWIVEAAAGVEKGDWTLQAFALCRSVK